MVVATEVRGFTFGLRVLVVNGWWQLEAAMDGVVVGRGGVECRWRHGAEC